MEYKKLGNSPKLKSAGETTEITCPKCNNKVNMSVYKNFDVRLKAEFPLVDAKNVYMLVCPSCASIYGVDHAKAVTFDKGEKLAIGNFDLKELKTIEF